MSQLTDNLSAIAAIKSDIRAAIESKGVSMSGVSFGSYAAKIGEIETGGTFVTEPLNVTDNGTYTPGQGVDGYSQVTVNVPQSVTGFTQKEITEGVQITDLNNSAVKVHEYAFINNYYLRTVNLPNCKEVLASAFQNCSNLLTVDLPLCGYLGVATFSDCNSLQQVSLPTVVEISNSALRNCGSLTSLSLCTDVYWTISYNSRVMTNTPLSSTGSIYVRSDTYSLWITSTGWSSLSDRFVSVDMGGIALSFNDGVVYGTTKALQRGFEGYLGITKSNITEVSLPECVYLMSSVLSYLSLNSVYLPECVELGSKVFESTSILSINLPECKTIQYGAFYYCKSTHYINIPKCEYIGDVVFLGCFGLESIDLPLCSYIGSSVFQNCYTLSEVSLPKCEYIGRDCFSACKFSTLNLPVCSYIGNLTFRNMASTFKTLVLGYSSVVTTGGQIFVNADPSIYVPASLVEAYKHAENWSYYSSKIFPIE